MNRLSLVPNQLRNCGVTNFLMLHHPFSDESAFSLGLNFFLFAKKFGISIWPVSLQFSPRSFLQDLIFQIIAVDMLMNDDNKGKQVTPNI